MSQVQQITEFESVIKKPDTSNNIETISKNTNGTQMEASDKQDSEGALEIKFKDWGFKVDRLFEVAYRFYKRNESKAFHLSFDVRSQLNALILQARFGNFDHGKAPDIGVLDLVGKNRRHQWSLLKGMSKTEAMSKFICTLDEICPFFKAYAEAVKLSSDSQSPNQCNNNSSIKSHSGQQKPQEEQLKAIQTSLCRQTYNQFKNYAEKQYPNDLAQQKQLISSLQEQYCRQYISQLHMELHITDEKSETRESLQSPSSSESSSSKVVTNDTITVVDKNGPVANAVVNKVQSKDVSIQRPTPNNISEQSISSQPVLNDLYLRCEEQTYSSNVSTQNSSPHIAVNMSDNIEGGIQPAPNPISQAHKSGIKSNQSIEPTSDKQKPYDGWNYKPPISCERDIDLHNIGKFESYPEPKPLQLTSNTAQTTNLLSNPNFDPNNPKQQSQPQTSSLYKPTKDLSRVPHEPVAVIPQQPGPHVNKGLPPEQLPPPGRLELPPPPQMQTFDSATPNRGQHSIPNNLPTSSSNHLHDKIDQHQHSENCEIYQKVEATWESGSSSEEGSPLQQPMSYEPLEPASIWTKKGVIEFKDSLTDDKHGGAYIVKQGTLLTIQVPTYPDGKYIYFEFATEDYDIGFGLDFLYESNLTKPLALRIFEETDEDNDEDIDELESKNDVNNFESAPGSGGQMNGTPGDARLDLIQKQAERFARTANAISIVPTYRRDSHEEVFVGRHRYPGKGYYLLKFDNTYSVLRSKSLFFRVCYFI